MKKASWVLASLLSIGGAAIAQNAPLSGISETTDPSKVAEVERRAQEVQAAAQQQGTPARAEETGAASRTKAKSVKRHKARKAKVRKSATSS
ncbi:MAG TPA: hypothetical protein DIT28_17550 [Oxalobacteraceae bacterium]|jgi:hypothetical protein|nr:hypothetical protein [Oxalobacteraceae bacterium]HCN90953.1 hypothetical protein [Oxalobacteraceae bacterium]